jgi:hypothetical protein
MTGTCLKHLIDYNEALPPLPYSPPILLLGGLIDRVHSVYYAALLVVYSFHYAALLVAY